jgi:DNA-binding CsgD family transcriptional regulator/pimeloyl-ACP methyl ester carboxylesterase
MATPEPQIGYVRSSDGATIAYYDIGEGRPVVWLDMPYSHLQFEWRQDQEAGKFIEFVASMNRVIRYDHRGFGLSERAPARFSLDDFVSDLEAVVARLDVPAVTLMATRGPTTPIAIAYAARHPDRVQNLIIFNAAARAPDTMCDQLRDLLRLAAGDWRFASEGVSRLALGWDDEDEARRMADLLRASIEMDGFARWTDEYASWDVRHLLPKVRARALLTAALGHVWYSEAYAREMAADMPDARVYVADGATNQVRVAQTAAAVGEFMGLTSGGAVPPAVTGDETTLTEREIEVLQLLAAGLSNRVIAERLVISVRTVETHVAHIYAKLGVTTRVAATAHAISRGLA